MKRSHRCWILFAAIALIAAGCSSSDDNTTPDPDTGPTPTPDKGTTPDPDKGTTPDPDKGTTPPADQGGPKKVEDYVPASGAAAGWVEDDTVGKPGVEAAYTDKEIFDLINGHHQPYADEGTKGFAKEDYMKDGHQLSLEIWEMKEAAGAKAMFELNKKTGETDAGWTFDTIEGVTTAAIINSEYDAGWTAYGYKGAHIYQVIALTADDQTALRQAVVDFIKHLAGGLPGN